MKKQIISQREIHRMCFQENSPLEGVKSPISFLFLFFFPSMVDALLRTEELESSYGSLHEGRIHLFGFSSFTGIPGTNHTTSWWESASF